MSQLLSPSHTLADSIPLGRRISEIMAEKGSAYTISAMSKRLDINRETYRLMLKGEREIYTFELEKIAQDLKLPVERILQVDIVVKRQVMEEKLAILTDLPGLVELAEELLISAIGLTEKIISLNYVGASCYYHRLVDRALEMWRESLSLAKEFDHKYDDPNFFQRLAGNLMLIYCDRNMYAEFQEIFACVEHLFDRYPLLSSTAYYSLAKFNELQGNLQEAYQNHVLCLHYSKQTDLHFRTSKFKYYVALAEYRLKNYLKSKEMFEELIAEEFISHDPVYDTDVHQHYGMALLRLKEFEEAKQALQIASHTSKTLVELQREGLDTELNFLLAITLQDPMFAESIVHNEKVNLQFRKLVCKFLIDQYDEAGDQAAKETYQTFYNQNRAAIDMVMEERRYTIDDYLNIYDFCETLGWIKHTAE